MQDEINNIQNDSSLDDVFSGDFTAEKVIIPKCAETDTAGKVKGVKIFCLILVGIIIAGSLTFGGYFAGKRAAEGKVFEDKGYFQLQNKPSNNAVINSERIYADIADTVVGIYIYNEFGSKASEATGVVFSENGYIITNDHIYDSIPSAKFRIYFSDGSEYDAYFVAGDTRSDIAVLKISADVKLKVPVFGNSDEVAAGETVFAIGCPNGHSAKATITEGIVSAPKIRRSITTGYASSFIQTDSAINPGNSGGALVNAHGQIIGITSAKISDTDYEGIGFAIPTTVVQKVTSSLIENGNVKDRVKLGITYQFCSEIDAKLNHLPSRGLLITEITRESDMFGKVEIGDILVGIDDKPINDSTVIHDILEQFKPDETVNITVCKKDGSTETVAVALLSDAGSSSYKIATK